MDATDEFCPAALRVFDAWESGQRARNWSIDDIEEALRFHRHRWQEAHVRVFLAYHHFDSDRKSQALGQWAFAYRMVEATWSEDEIFRWTVMLEYAFVAARCGRPLDATDDMLVQAHRASGLDPYIPILMTRAKAAQLVARKDRRAFEHIEIVDRYLRSQSDAEQDNIQAELDWLQDMRNDLFQGGTS
ncbi:MAG: hypothetical protein ACO1SV_02910 [Fimbriimonas sp.]